MKLLDSKVFWIIPYNLINVVCIIIVLFKKKGLVNHEVSNYEANYLLLVIWLIPQLFFVYRSRFWYLNEFFPKLREKDSIRYLNLFLVFTLLYCFLILLFIFFGDENQIINVKNKMEDNYLEKFLRFYLLVFFPFFTSFRYAHFKTIFTPKLLKTIKTQIEHYNPGKYNLNQYFDYKNDQVTLFCDTHGLFTTKLDNVLNGIGCDRCINETEILESRNIFQKNFDEIKVAGEKTLITVNRIDNNLNILSKVSDLKNKNENNNIEETIKNIVDLIKDKYEFKDVKKYIDNVTNWFKYWDNLEPLSQNFLTQSEYLYDSIENSSFNDYSPFVLYSCRALEYELLQKIFIKYHDYINLKYSNKEILFDYDKSTINSRTVKDIETGVIKSFKRYLISDNPRYTLGDMRLLLNILPSKTKPSGSKRYQALLSLKELNYFVDTQIGKIPSRLIKDIQKISSNYRNPSAHTGIINKEKADEFHKIYKQMMNDLLRGFK